MLYSQIPALARVKWYRQLFIQHRPMDDISIYIITKSKGGDTWNIGRGASGAISRFSGHLPDFDNVVGQLQSQTVKRKKINIKYSFFYFNGLILLLLNKWTKDPFLGFIFLATFFHRVILFLVNSQVLGKTGGEPFKILLGGLGNFLKTHNNKFFCLINIGLELWRVGGVEEKKSRKTLSLSSPQKKKIIYLTYHYFFKKDIFLNHVDSHI